MKLLSYLFVALLWLSFSLTVFAFAADPICPTCPKGMVCICEELKPSPPFDENNLKIGKNRHIGECRKITSGSSFPKTRTELTAIQKFIIWEEISNVRTTRYLISEGDWPISIAIFDDGKDSILDRICPILEN